MKKLQPRVIGINILGAIGYTLTALAWALLMSVVLVFFEAPVAVESPSPVISVGLPEGFATGIGYAVAVVMGLLTLGILVALPYLVGKLGSTGLRQILALLRIPPSRRSMFFAKSIASVLPLVGFFVVTFLLSAPSMTFSTIYFTTVVTAVLALFCFLLQLIIARALHIPERSVW